MRSISHKISKRWIGTRPGSVLILVIALLVLLALIGTAYLSSTQTERYSSLQNTLNTQADLLLKGMSDTLSAKIVSGVFGGTGYFSQYRPPSQEMPAFVNGVLTPPLRSSYYHYDALFVDPSLQATDPEPPDLFLAQRIPDVNTFWNTVSWPLIKNASGSYDVVGSGVNKNSTAFSTGSLADADGDGIGDAQLFDVGNGPINGITYKVAIRVIDNNSAINASTAWTMGNDVVPAGNTPTNYGFFRSNTGLKELLFTSAASGIPPTAEINALNTYRLGGFPPTPPSASGPAQPTLSTIPAADTSVPMLPNNFQWYSYGDILENQLNRRPGNPGYGLTGSNCQWLGLSQSAGLAYHFSLLNAGANPSVIEQLLPNELLNYVGNRSLPYAARFTGSNMATDPLGYWYHDLFYNLNKPTASTSTQTYSYNAPLRSLLTCSNAVSNAIPSRRGNVDQTGVPLPFDPAKTYDFGDWVIGADKRSYVCLVTNRGYEPSATVASAPQSSLQSHYWAMEPFTQQAVKTSVNTATFEQLWVAFAQVMTDSISPDPLTSISSPGPVTGAAEWQPPMQPVAPVAPADPQPQLGMFRSTLRDPKTIGRSILTSSQMLKLRAALAAVNAMDLRDSDDDVTSRHIVITDGTTTTTNWYDVEVYGTERQPYIVEIVMQFDGTRSHDYVAIELYNPYDKPITLTNWQIATLNRSTFPAMMLSSQAGLIIPPNTQIPASIPGGAPGVLILEDNLVNRPSDVKTPLATPSGTSNIIQLTGLALAMVDVTNTANEVFLMRPRLAASALPNQTSSKPVNTAPASPAYYKYPNNDPFDEDPVSNAAGYLADCVPVDQIDLTGLSIPVNAAGATRYIYRRGTDSAVNKGWHCVYPGAYNASSTSLTGRYSDPVTASSAIMPSSPVSPNIPDPCNLGAATGLGDNTLLPMPAPYTANATTFRTAPIELNNDNMGGPNKMTPTAGTYMFPFGQFARQADMLQIPFIGAYRIRRYSATYTPSNTVMELNSVSMDSALANDNTTGTYALPAAQTPWATNSVLPTNTQTPGSAINEQIGRFCLIGDPYAFLNGLVPAEFTDSAASPPPILIAPAALNSATPGNRPNSTLQLDYGPGYDTANDPTIRKKIYWHYHWANRLFDYLTVQAPHDDYYPNVDPAPAPVGVTPAGSYPAKYPGALPPVSMANGSDPAVKNDQTAGTSEDAAGVEGLININTAPACVLAMLPFPSFPNPQKPSTPYQSIDYAKAIAEYRAYYGPFQSAADLNRIPFFIYAYHQLARTAAVGPSLGVFSPGGIGTASAPANAVRFDFQDRFFLVNQVSNLVTTRSDSFTCYVMVQGFRNGNGVAVQRRSAFILDRTGVTPSNKIPLNFKIPSE